MAPPRTGSARRAPPASDRLFTLGQQGRKTGVTWRDTGVRDEHGMEPIDDIFSSPAKSPNDDDAYDDEEEEEDNEAEEQQDDDENDSGDYGEADMDLTTASGPDPATLLNGRAAMRPAHLAARSPAKALFGSPPVRSSAGSKAVGSGALRRSAAIRHNPALRPPTSPAAAAAETRAAAPQELLSSSPTRPVKRRLDFGKTAGPGAQRKPYALPPPQNGSTARGQRDLQYDDHSDDGDDDDSSGEDAAAATVGQQSYTGNNHDDSMQMIGGDDVDYNDPEPDEPAVEEEPVRVKKRGRPPNKAKAAAAAAAAPSAQPVAGKKRGRSSRSSGGSDVVLPSREVDHAESGYDNQDEDEEEAERQTAKRQRTMAEPAAPAPAPAEPKPRGRPRGRPPTKSAPALAPPAPVSVDDEPAEASADAGGEAAAAAPKKRERKRKSSGVGAATAAAAAVPRGPPLPKSRGLVIRRRDEDDGAVKTRSGRSSFRPLAFWRNEHAEFAPDVQHDSQGRRIVLPTVQEIVRVEDEALPTLASMAGRHGGGGGGRRGRPKGGGSSRRAAVDNDDDEGDDDDGRMPAREPWETDPGNVTGEVIVWHAEHELDPPAPGEEVEMAPSEIALSAAAIQTHEVRGGTFRFVKTLSLPFFGTGMVDLPPGAEKRPKNSRKMHMTFFVHYGQVLVMVNDTSFRIAKGGMWSVPRGNYYSIVNDSDRPARIFFAQGCEILTSLEPEEAEANGE